MGYNIDARWGPALDARKGVFCSDIIGLAYESHPPFDTIELGGVITLREGKPFMASLLNPDGYTAPALGDIPGGFLVYLEFT